MRRETLDRLAVLGFKDYAAYIASDLWTENKARAGLTGGCWICGTTRSLHHHHVSYERVGRERAGDLILLCSGHHTAVHRIVRRGTPLDEAHVRLRENRSLGRKKAKSRRKKGPKPRGRKTQPNKVRTTTLSQASIDYLESENTRLREHQAAAKARREALLGPDFVKRKKQKILDLPLAPPTTSRSPAMIRREKEEAERHQASHEARLRARAKRPKPTR